MDGEEELPQRRLNIKRRYKAERGLNKRRVRHEVKLRVGGGSRCRREQEASEPERLTGSSGVATSTVG